MEGSEQLLRIERRQCCDALRPLLRMSDTARANYIVDLGLDSGATPADIIDHLASAVMSAPRGDRALVIESMLASNVSYEKSARPPSYSAATDERKVGSNLSLGAFMEASEANSATAETNVDFVTPELLQIAPSRLGDEPPRARAHQETVVAVPTTQPVAPRIKSRKPSCAERLRQSCHPCSANGRLGWTVLCLLALPVGLYGGITGLAWDHTRYHTQLFAGLMGALFVWPVIGLLHTYAGYRGIGGCKCNCASVVVFLLVLAFSFALVVPLAILFGEGIQGVFYYSRISVTNNVSLCDIPLTGGTQAYRVTNGAFVRSSYHVYTDFVTSTDDNGNTVVSSVSQGYAVRVSANCSTDFNVWVVYTNNANPPSTYNDVFDNGIFQHSLVRLDCARDDNCPVTTYTVDQVDTGPVLLMRNKDPSDRFQVYYDKMMNVVPASAVFLGLLVVVSVLHGIFMCR